MSRSNRSYGCLPRYVEWIIGLVILVVLAAVLWPVTGPPAPRRKKIHRQVCATQMVSLVVATQAYAEDNDGRLPNTDQWHDAMAEFVDHEAMLRCPARHDDPLPHYALNPSVAGMKMADLGDRAEVVLIYEVNERGLPVFPHKGRANYVFMNADQECLEDPPEGSGLPVREE